ncbi:hypothetical protein [Rhodanobacter denitrificans]|uniref:hypothetical protein n=1 Tax=Rhodanobacter denitrificans TaxID=666685 RepID=UPI001F447D81|nr:hypothetical protein [Rhodanobacter denitrificans]UJJ60431.1 hypothetical protein LRK55_18500 [Rhodanobacter denitrificans]
MTVLNVHDRHAVLRPLPGAVTAALVHCFGNDPHPTDAEKEVATKALMDLRDHQQWLACSCAGADADPPPLMAPRLREGQIHVWRHGETPHAAACPFWVEASQTEGKHEGPAPAAVASATAGPWLLLRQPASDGSAPTPPTPGEAPHSAAGNVPAIARLLFTALTDADYTVVSPDDIVTARDQPARSRLKDSYAGLDALRGREVAPGLRFRDVGCTYLPALPRLLHTMSGLEAKFPANLRPQGLFVGIVHEVVKVSATEGQLLWQGGAENRAAIVRVRGSVKLPGRTTGQQGPYWAIAQIAKPKGESRYVVVNAYAHPCLSKSVLLPVDSALERDTAELLLAQMAYWAREKGLGVKVQLEKPLFPELLEDGTVCHPDFILWLPDRKRILVETMGMTNDPDYLASKARTHPRMRQLPGVIALVEHHPGDDPAKLQRMLTAIVARSAKAR